MEQLKNVDMSCSKSEIPVGDPEMRLWLLRETDELKKESEISLHSHTRHPWKLGVFIHIPLGEFFLLAI